MAITYTLQFCDNKQETNQAIFCLTKTLNKNIKDKEIVNKHLIKNILTEMIKIRYFKTIWNIGWGFRFNRDVGRDG